MKLVKSIKYLNKILDRYRNDGFKIHLTPTMGALHGGHLKLVKKSFCGSTFFVDFLAEAFFGVFVNVFDSSG